MDCVTACHWSQQEPIKVHHLFQSFLSRNRKRRKTLFFKPLNASCLIWNEDTPKEKKTEDLNETRQKKKLAQEFSTVVTCRQTK